MTRLYLDGKPKGELSSRMQTLGWDVNKNRIMLGFAHPGWIDDLAIFERELSATETARLHE